MNDVKLGEILLSQEDLQFKLKSNRGVFLAKIADPSDKKIIIRNTAQAVGHSPLDSIPVEDYLYIVALETLKIVVIDSPDWFDSFESLMDDALIIELYTQYAKSEKDFRRRLREGKFRKNIKEG